MDYTRWQPGGWRNLPDKTTPAPAAFLQQIEDTFVQVATAITNLEGSGSSLFVPKSLFTTKGDLVVATASGTVVRLPVGTNNHVLTADSNAGTGVAWSPQSGGGVTAHSALTGLTNNDHTQYSLTSHLHTDKADLISGRVPTAQLGTGSATSSTFLRGDQTWGTPVGATHVSVRAMSTGQNITLSGTQTIDGASLVVGRRVFLIHQTNPLENGIYDVQSGAWTRSSDFTGVVNNGLLVSVRNGVIGHDTLWYICAPGVDSQSLTVGTDTLAITKIGSDGIYTNISGTTLFTVDAAGCFVCVLSQDATISIREGFQDRHSIVRVCVIQDATGGRNVWFAPGTIAWETADILSEPFTSPDIDTTPHSITFIEVMWLGSTRGFVGKKLTGIRQYYTALPTTWASQTLHIPGEIMRFTRQSVVDLVLNALTTYVTAAHRQRLVANNLRLGIADRFPTDTLYGAQYRGSGAEQFGAFVGDGLNGQGVAMNMRGFGYLGGGEALQVTNAAIHEYSHVEDNYYYGGNNPADPHGQDLISRHPTLTSLFTDCFNNGAAYSNNEAGRVEWYAELRKGQRKADNGDQLVQVGTGTTGSTPQARVNSFNNYINSLGLL